MHLLSGPVKLLFVFWFTIEYKNHPASLLKHLEAINNRLCSIEPPSSVERMPRSLRDFKYWKALELIIFLLNYSSVLFHDKMPGKYFNHHYKLVLGISLSYQKSVSMNDLRQARRLLYSYVSEYP